MRMPPQDWLELLAAASERAGRTAGVDAPGQFDGAPEPVRRIAANFARMESMLADHGAALVAAHASQQAAALEMNHRIRNNLQIIGSFLNLQAQGLPVAAERSAIERTRLRVAAMALVHRLILDRGDHSSIQSGELIDAICALVSNSIEIPSGFDLDCRAQGHAVPIDTAVPLALWTVEAVEVVAMRGSGAPDGRIAVRLLAADDVVELVVRGDGLASPPAPDPVPDRLLGALARQMGTHLERHTPTPTEEELRIRLTASFAEQRPG